MRRKMLLSYIAVLLLFGGCTFLFVLRTVYHMVRDNLVEVSGQAMTQRSSELVSVMEFGRTYILNLITNDQIQDLLRQQSASFYEHSGAIDPDTLSWKLEQNSLLKKVMYTNSVTMKNMPFLTEVCCRSSNGSYVPVYYSGRQNSKQGECYDLNDPWIRALKAQKGQFLWSVYTDEANEFIRLSKIIYDTQDYSREIGIISLDLSYVHLAQSVLYQLRSQSGIDAALISYTTGEIIGYNTISLPSAAQQRLGENGSTLINNKQDCLFVRRLAGTDFCLVGIKSLEEARRTYQRASLLLVVAALAALGLGLVLAMVLSRKITRPIVELSYIMQDVQSGDLDITATTGAKGEIGELYSSFNYMIQMINTLIEENYVTRLNQKQSELNALQSQINTHFLYNTLDSINWLARDYHANDICLLVTNLSRLLRTSLNNGNAELSVRQELEHARSYLHIQAVRFHDLFIVQEEVDEGILEDTVLKMLLQPLVENAILHAFHPCGHPPEQNRLVVRAKDEGETLRLEVSNSAAPAALEQINRCLSSAPGKPQKSYGIQSIQSRLVIAYGGEAQYFYSYSAQGLLNATIHIPRRFTKQGRLETPDTGEILP